jgi:hypothetical protein
MPLFDLLGGTLDDQSWEVQKQTSAGTYCMCNNSQGLFASIGFNSIGIDV